MEVLAQRVEVMRRQHDEYKPTPRLARPFLNYTRAHCRLADGIVSNPRSIRRPRRIQYNPPDGDGTPGDLLDRGGGEPGNTND